MSAREPRASAQSGGVLMYERACEHCGTVFVTEYASKLYCQRSCKESARKKRDRVELQVRRATAQASRWQRFRVAVLWAWHGGPIGPWGVTSPEPSPPDRRGAAHTPSQLRDTPSRPWGVTLSAAPDPDRRGGGSEPGVCSAFRFPEPWETP